MKIREKLIGTFIIGTLLVFSSSAFAQRGERSRMMRQDAPRMERLQDHNRISAVLDLSDEQKEKIQDLRSNHQKEMMYSRNLLNEKNARLKTLLSAPDNDEKAINSVIDEISSMKGDLMKNQISNREEIKGVLTPDQLQKFEALGKRLHQRRGPGLNGRFDDHGSRNFKGRRGGFEDRGNRNFHGRGLGLPNN